MTNEAQAVYTWLSGFQIPAYASTSVPSDAAYPYLTYELPVGEWQGGELALTVDLWYYGDSESVPNAKAREIRAALGLGGVKLDVDGGQLWLKRGSPFSQPWKQDDDKVKSRRVNVSIEYLTTD